MASELVLKTLRHVWLTLKPLNVPMAVVGGLALATWKHIRATRDIDILLGIPVEKLAPVLERLDAVGIRPKSGPSPVSLGHLKLVQLLYEPPESFMELQVDLLLADSPYHRVALERSVPTLLPELDIEISVLACEDLILNKLSAGRLIDLADAAALLQANRDNLDTEYLNRWAGELGVAAELAKVRAGRA
ncbi:MAG: nucleotidyl transferase AbiEii/AbiGii toxin family protein [Thermoguttaceae bacterium]